MAAQDYIVGQSSLQHNRTYPNQAHMILTVKKSGFYHLGSAAIPTIP